MISQERREELVKKLISAGGDFGKLSEKDRQDYYLAVCETNDLNPMTQPFDFLVLNGKLRLYAKRDCTDQLAKKHRLSRQMIEEKVLFDTIYTVTARVVGPDGRVTENTGKVNIKGLSGDALANALMKAETKAFRRAILGHCGLGFSDETEIETIPEASILEDVKHEPEPAETTEPNTETQAEAKAEVKAEAKAETPNGQKKQQVKQENQQSKQEQEGQELSQEKKPETKATPYEGVAVISGEKKEQNGYSGVEAVDAATDEPLFLLTNDPKIAELFVPGYALKIKGLINRTKVGNAKAAVLIQEAEKFAEEVTPDTTTEAPSDGGTEADAGTPNANTVTIIGDAKETTYRGSKTLYVYGVTGSNEKVCLVGDLKDIAKGDVVEVEGEWTKGKGGVRVVIVSAIRKAAA